METKQLNLVFGRSIFVNKNLQPGELLTAENLCIIRPGDGLQLNY